MNKTLVLFCFLGMLKIPNSTVLQATVTLSQGETALIDPSPYFNNLCSDFTITASGSSTAAVLPQLSIKELAAAAIEGEDWHFGASANTPQGVFLSVVFAQKLEVWMFDGHSLTKQWETVAQIKKVVRVSITAVIGFVYWSLPNVGVYFIDLAASSLSAKEIKGFDTVKVTHIAVCSLNYSTILVQDSPEGKVIRRYLVDYQSYTAELSTSAKNTLIDEDLVDMHCEVDTYYLSRRALFFGYEHMLDIVRIPSSLGTPLSLGTVSETELVSVIASNGVIKITPTVLLLPGVARVLSLDSDMLLVESSATGLIITLVSTPLGTCKRIVPLHLESADSIMQTSLKRVLAQKEKGRLVLFTLLTGTSLLRVSAEPQPYELTLCAVSCAQVRVNPLAEGSGVMQRDLYYLFLPSVIQVSAPLHSRKSSITVNFLENVSGPNLDTRLSFPKLPDFLSFKPRDTGESEHTESTIVEVDGGAELLCSHLNNNNYTAMFSFQGKLIGNSAGEYSRSILLDLSNIVCAFSERNFFLYGMDKDSIGRFMTFSSMPQILPDAGFCTDMKEVDAVVVLICAKRVLIMHKVTHSWQRIEGQYQSAIVDDAFLALRTAFAIYVYRLHGYIYLLEGEIRVDSNVVEVVLLRETVVTLDSSNRLDFYHLSAEYQLTHRFSYAPDCQVQYIMEFDLDVAYRCQEYFQLLSAQSLKHSVELQRVAAQVRAVAVDRRGGSSSIHELHRANGQWTLWSYYIRSPARESSTFDIEVSRDYDIPDSIVFQGVLKVVSQSATVDISVNVTLANYGAVITTSNPLPYDSVVEVPWDEELSFQPSEYFQGGLMLFSAQSSDPRVNVQVQNSMVIDYFLTLPKEGLIYRVVPDSKILFSCDRETITARKFECNGRHCTFTSSTPIVLSTAMQDVEVIITFGVFTILKLTSYYQDPASITRASMIIVSFDSEKQQFEQLLSKPVEAIRQQVYVVRSAHAFHLFLYGSALDHCVGTWNARVELQCQEVTFPAVVQVVAIGSAKQPGGCWHIYILTRTQLLVTILLCADLHLLSSAPVRETVPSSVEKLLILGRKLVILHSGGLAVFSLPSLELLHTTPVDIKQVTSSQISYWRGTDPLGYISIRSNDFNYQVFDFDSQTRSTSLVSFRLDRAVFTGPAQIAGVQNRTLVIASFAQARIVVPKDDTQTDTVHAAILISAENGLSKVRQTLKVVRKVNGYLYWLVPALCVAMVGGGAFVCKRRTRDMKNEVELQRFS